ncbi:DUF5107 domain-containing protein [Tessaracoccus antarcticus]|uniref:DUF5107 domain-containing protein n=1 Tax=Tessaracoccus antarcticus TaxID=2479848 RepID=A0A3M0GA75_9ACTN|nr:DUF5107 domain-containing protein [Tessaracoccus antarcticus]RMB61794.1 DUF5107 domain-containing protein [Tessaracoccus antarcticus]
MTMATTGIPRHTTDVDQPVPEELQIRLESGEAVVWRQTLTLPTYEPDDPSQYPMYLDNRVYQGSSGRVYPMPFVEGVARTPVPRAWHAVFLENLYVRVVVLPELGGRIYSGYDKTTGYDFFYRNRVIKPALVGLDGPWISGGVEFNWPQHHRPATYFPTEAALDMNDDGSATVWCGDHDPFARMHGTHGIRLHADRSVVEILARLHNRTNLDQTFLWWANAAVRVHDQYQSFFPQDVTYVADHARRAITAFPKADRPYYGVDYPRLAEECAGADRIDFYRNIKAPTSYMIVDTDESFFGGYDHAAEAGVVHWADKRISPGKKQWTWGNSPFGQAWDRHLTDEDGPYIELMAGVYTDNQPDFAWLSPGEVKRFSQFWYPIPGIGVAHQATVDAAVHVDLTRTGATSRVDAAFTVTRPTTAVLRIRDIHCGVLHEEEAHLVPGEVARIGVELPESLDAARVRVQLCEGDDVMLEWKLATPDDAEPWSATEPPQPSEVASADELYLTGLHLEQYRHPTRSPLPYWAEALRRDPGDARVNLALARREYRAGKYRRARDHAEAAVARLTVRNERLRDTEAYYVLGLILLRLGEMEEAARQFGRAGWDNAWVMPAGFETASILARNGQHARALAEVELLLLHGAEHPRLVALRVIVLRRLGRLDEAGVLLRAARSDSRVDDVLAFLADGALPTDGNLLVDLGLDLAAAGEHIEALRVWQAATMSPVVVSGNARPVAHYLMAATHQLLGDATSAALDRSLARAADRRWAFPVGLDAHDALVAAIAAEPDDAVARLLLGMLLYDAGRRSEAQELWEEAVSGGLADAVLLRNAGLAAYNVTGDDERSWVCFMKARELAPEDARLLYEQDLLAELLGHPVSERLQRLELAATLVGRRDDLVVRYANLLTVSGRASEALVWIESRQFQPWEGGEGEVLGAWDAARDALGLPREDPPLNLGEARPVAIPPVAVHDDGHTDYFATSLPERLLFHRINPR